MPQSLTPSHSTCRVAPISFIASLCQVLFLLFLSSRGRRRVFQEGLGEGGGGGTKGNARVKEEGVKSERYDSRASSSVKGCAASSAL